MLRWIFWFSMSALSEDCWVWINWRYTWASLRFNLIKWSGCCLELLSLEDATRLLWFVCSAKSYGYSWKFLLSFAVWLFYLRIWYYSRSLLKREESISVPSNCWLCLIYYSYSLPIWSGYCFFDERLLLCSFEDFVGCDNLPGESLRLKILGETWSLSGSPKTRAMDRARYSDGRRCIGDLGWEASSFKGVLVSIAIWCSFNLTKKFAWLGPGRSSIFIYFDAGKKLRLFDVYYSTIGFYFP